MPDHRESESASYPFVAQCRVLSTSAPLRWLKHGFIDFRAAIIPSVIIGLLMSTLVMTVVLMAWQYGSAWIMFSLLCGFVFLAPIACIALYAISAQLQRGQVPSLIRAFRACSQRYLGSEMVFALILLVVFLIWARASSMASIFIPNDSGMPVSQMRDYLLILSGISVLFLSITFALSIFALPMIMHRNVDVVTAVVSSINAVLRNKLVLFFWGILLASMIGVGIASAGLGLIVFLPTIGYAVWHGYLSTIDAAPFPRHEDGITATPVPKSK